MKKILILFSFASAAALMASGCDTREASPKGEEAFETVNVHFRAVNPLTKVAFVESGDSETPYSSIWESTDAIGISVNALDVVTSSSITLQSEGAGAEFDATLADDGSGSYTLWAVSPACQITKTEIQNSNRIMVKIPDTQTPSATSPDPLSVVIAGTQSVTSLSENIDVEFSHYGAYLHFVLKGLSEGESVSSVAVESNAKLAGTGYVEFAKTVSLKASAAKKALTINPVDVAANSDGEADVWAGVFRGDALNTLSVTVTTDKKTYDTVSLDLSSASYKLTAGQSAKINVDLSSSEGGEEETEDGEGKYTADLENDWSAATSGATYTFGDGYASIVTAASGAKFRGDVKYTGSEGVVLHAGNYPYLAIRMTLEGDSRNVTIDGKSSDGSSYKGALGGGSNKKKYAETLSDDSVVWVYDLSSQKWGSTSVLPTTEAVTFTTFQIKYADIVADSAPTWKLYDVQTFATLDAVNSAYGTSFSE